MPHYWPGRSLLELYRGEMSWRELRVFIQGLPPESRTMRALSAQSPEERLWTFDRHLQAMLIDAVRENTFASVVLQGDPKKTKNLKPPEPIQRPGVEPRNKPGVIRFGGRHGSGAKALASVFGAPGG